MSRGRYVGLSPTVSFSLPEHCENVLPVLRLAVGLCGLRSFGVTGRDGRLGSIWQVLQAGLVHVDFKIRMTYTAIHLLFM